jgi:hypothetical protein
MCACSFACASPRRGRDNRSRRDAPGRRPRTERSGAAGAGGPAPSPARFGAAAPHHAFEFEPRQVPFEARAQGQAGFPPAAAAARRGARPARRGRRQGRRAGARPADGAVGPAGRGRGRGGGGGRRAPQRLCPCARHRPQPPLGRPARLWRAGARRSPRSPLAAPSPAGLEGPPAKALASPRACAQTLKPRSPRPRPPAAAAQLPYRGARQRVHAVAPGRRGGARRRRRAGPLLAAGAPRRPGCGGWPFVPPGPSPPASNSSTPRLADGVYGARGAGRPGPAKTSKPWRRSSQQRAPGAAAPPPRVRKPTATPVDHCFEQRRCSRRRSAWSWGCGSSSASLGALRSRSSWCTSLTCHRGRPS